jgi:hypothetical protein
MTAEMMLDPKMTLEAGGEPLVEAGRDGRGTSPVTAKPRVVSTPGAFLVILGLVPTVGSETCSSSRPIAFGHRRL